MKINYLLLSLLTCFYTSAEFCSADISNAVHIYVKTDLTNNTGFSIHSDDPYKRFVARIRESFNNEPRGNGPLLSSLVFEYSIPTPENLSYPFVFGYVRSAELTAKAGKTFDAVRRLEIARDKSPGLGRIAALRALSEIVETQPDLAKALAFEKDALSTGNRWFVRERISESAGLAPAKEGAEIWEKLKPIIEARIKELERRVDIDRYGLDYVLYREAQTFRRSSHPAALDFTDIPAAFRMRNTRLPPNIPGADFEAARKQYLEIVQLFPEGVYNDASRLYAAVCLAHLADPRGAMRELTDFYKRNPDGLYRGEALLLLGDLYLVGQWDPANAKEAYSRASAWVVSVGERQRVLDTYAVPEKSVKVSKPPERPRNIDQHGQISGRGLDPGFLVNRMTAEWYLPRLRAEVEWKLGFLAVVADEDEAAKSHFDQALEQDNLLQQAVGMKVFNPYDRLLMSLKNNVFAGKEEDMLGLQGKIRLAMHWADFHFMLENFELSKDLYRRIQQAATEEKDETALIRATVGEAIVRHAQNEPDRAADTPRLYALAQQYPRAPATPQLLWHCAVITDGDPVGWRTIFDEIIKKYPRSRHTLEARYNFVLRLPFENHDIRREMIAQFKKDYPQEKDYHRYLDRWESNLMEYLADRDLRRTLEKQKAIEKSNNGVAEEK